MARPATLYISRKNLAHNLKVVEKHSSDCKIMAVIKANAYGHGMVEVASELAKFGVNALAVCSLDEALVLRDARISLPIVLLTGFFSELELSKIISLNLIPVIHNLEQFEILRKHKIPSTLGIIIKIDTGMHRLGFASEIFKEIYQKLQQVNGINIFAVMSHFARADEPASKNNVKQLENFNKAVAKVDLPKSMANSAAILTLPHAHFDWIRPGIMLYGANPLTIGSFEDYNLKPVMRFESEVVEVKHVNTGDEVGYGGAWAAKKPAKIAIVAAGYGDGYPRHAPSGTPVAVNSQIAPLAGRVSMDLLAVDVSLLDTVKIKDRVELWGNIVPVDKVANKSGTIAYELFCSISSRVARVYV